MEGPSRSTGFRQSRRSRSQRDRERRRRRVDLNEQRATSLSSASDQEACGTNGVRGPGGRDGRPGFGRHRPPRRRKRESVSCEEDIIDGFAIASFVSLEALEMDCSLKPNQRSDMPGRRNKGKRGPEQNGGPLSDPEAGGPHSFSRNKRRKLDEQGMPLETGYICDTESDSGGKASDNEIDPVFIVSTRKVVEPPVASMGSSIGKNGPPMPTHCGSVSRLMVTPRVSGLERSQEKSLEQNFTEPVTTSTSSACLPSHSSIPRSNAMNGSSSRHNANSPLSKPKPFLTLPGRSQSMYGINRSSTPVKPTSSASSIAASSMRPPTPSTSVSLSYIRGSSSSLPLRPPSRASGALFTSSPGLPPPPPLLQGPSHTSAAEREGRRSVPGSENATAGRSTPASSSTPGSSSRTSQNQPSIQPLAFQFHQHNHQHQHTHTHQHFTPFQYPPAAAPPLFEKYGKMNELYRHPFFPQFQPSVPSIQPVIPPTGPFSSLQGAFQPKPLVPQGTAPDLSARLGVVPHHLQPKDPRLTDPFGTSLKISNKPGKWCAMHVYVAWMILSHQKKVKLMQADPHKLDFRSDLLARLPGTGGLGPLGPMGASLPPTHDLTRPPTLFSASGGVNPSTAPFISPPAPHSSFLTPSHLDPYGRSPPFTPLGALGSGAFGGLGSPSLGGSVFGPKDSPATVVGGLSSNHHDPWSRLHGGPPGFPGPSWAKGPDRRDERDRGKDAERREIPHIKDEKDRDNMLYGRPPVRMSPVGPAFKPRSSTPVSHINGHNSALGPSSGPIEDLTRSLSRDRDRERERDSEKRPLSTVSSRGPPVGSSTLLGDRERPRSSSSSVLTTPPPSNRSAPSPLELYPRTLGSSAHSHHSESTHSQRESNPSSVASASVTSLTQAKKSDRTTPVSKSSLLLPPVKVKEERKEEPEHIPITLPPPPAPNHTFDRPNSHPHHHRSGTPSSSLTPTPGVSLPPPNTNPHLSLLDRSRAIDAYLGNAGPHGGLVIGPGAERFHHGPPHGSQGPHTFTWDPWRELAAQHQQQRREAMALRSDPHLALRSDPHLARLLQHQRLLEAERAAAVAAAAAAPHHPPTSTSNPSNSAVRQEFSLMAHPFDRHHQLGPPGGGLIDEEQRAQILREDFERARYFGMHPHLPGSHLSGPSHAATAAHLEQLHSGLLSHPLPPGASAAHHHAGLYSRLSHLNPHMANGILAKTPAGLVGALSMGAPPPLIPSVTSRSSTPPRRLGAPGELALFSAHKDGINQYPSSEMFRRCGGDPNFSILEVESTEDLCLQHQTGAVCSQSGPEEQSSGEEAVRQPASPAVEVLGADPQAAHNVAGESHQHAPQPVTAVPRPVPPSSNTFIVPLLDGEIPTSTPPILLEGLPAEGDRHSESELTVERVTGVFSTSSEDCSLSEMQRHPTHCPPLSSDIQLNNTVQELQNGSQTNEEQSPSNSQINQSQPAKAAEIVDIQGTQEKTSFTSEIQPETSVKEYANENVISQPPLSFQTSTTVSQISVEVQDPADSRAIEVELHTKTVTEQNSQLQTLTMPLFHRNESEIPHTEPAPEPELLHVPNFQVQDRGAGHQSLITDTDATECLCIQDTFTKPSSAPLLVETDPVVSLQTQQGTCPTEQVTSTEMPLIAQIVHSSGTHEIVVVRDDGDWSGVHLNQSYLLQREDGTVCQAAIINNLGSELSAGQTVHLDSQSVEVYQFCDLMEEVAEETVCGSSGIQIPHSPGYEVNLFNALLDNSDDFSLKEDLESQIDTTFHTIDEGDGVIISQQAVLSSHDGNQIVTCTSSGCHTMSIQNTAVAAVQQHLILNARQSDANTNEVCLVEVANVTSDSFAVEQANTSTEALDFSTQVEMAPDKSEPPQKREYQTSPLQVVGDAVHMDGQPSLKSTRGVTVVSATKLEPCVSSHKEAKEPATTVAPLQTIHTVVVTTSTETASPSPFLGKINPQLLILKPGTSPFLKPPASLVAQVSTGLNDYSSGTLSDECLSHTVSATGLRIPSMAPCSQNEQTNCSVKTPVQSLPTDSDSSLASKNEPLSQNLNGNISGPQSSTDVPVVVFETSEMDSTIVTEASFNDTVSQLDSLAGEGEDQCVEEDNEGEEGADEGEECEEEVEDEEMEQDAGEDVGDASVDECSSDEEGSNGEAEADRPEGESSPASPHKHGQSRTDRKALFLKVRQWIADRVSINSSLGSPSPGPSTSSDWSSPRLDRSSPLRGSHGKFVSPQDQSTPHRSRGERRSDMAEQAKHEADIENRTQALKREGFWSMKRLTRLTEPPRPKVHWEYLCEEMQWLSADFAQERRWKRGVARKVVRMVMRHHEELRQKEEKAKRDEQSKIRKVAASIAKEVRAFWSSVEKVVQYKQQSRLDEKRKKALDLQLDFIVGQTEKYSDLLSQSLARTAKPDHETDTAEPQKSQPTSVDEDDGDFEPQCEEEDDEETIDVEEQQEGNDAESHRREIELLKEEGMLSLDQLRSTLNLPQDGGSEAEGSDQSSSSAEEEDEDREFTANEEDAEDEEDTIAAQEKVEGNVDHSAELDDLAKEGDMSLEELLEKYKGAYAPDFEEPSASASKATPEVSGDEEEETEEDESDVESHTSSSESPGNSEEEESAEASAEDDASGDEGMEILLKEGDHSPTSSSSRPKKDMSHIAATAESLQPKGYTLATTKVKTPIPFLLHGTLREYQHIGLDWLVTMFEKKLNGILADEMGLGKTIQTIALLAHLACEKSNWGPHLIIVPTSVMLNWEMELKRWCPGFKILTYFGSQKERKLKRQGWTKPNAFHVCITSYKLVLQDHQAFRRKSWRYLILDEAQNIKNFKSQRWQSLLNFNSHRRLLLTGTPLQNSLMELWSLMHFLMPHVFQSHREFKEWFSNPLTGMIEGSQEYNEGLIKRLHKVLRPFLLRRIKADVEKQMPKKYEHVVQCRLSKRQRFLYDDFMSQASTRETLASGHFMSVINILMQLRKVCNHPNLFDPRPIQSPFITKPIVFYTASLVHEALEVSPFKRCDLSIFDLIGLEARVSRYQADVFMPKHKLNRQLIQEIIDSPEPPPRPKPIKMKVNRMVQPPPKGESRSNKPTSPVPPAVQPPKPPLVAEATPVTTAPAVQQVVCSVAPIPAPRPTIHPQTAVRSSTPKTVLTVRPPITPGTQGIPVHPTPSNVMPQRVLLSPDMQARLPSGEVVSIAQLASLAGRPVSSCQGSKPVTFQLQGNKLTLSGAQIGTPRPVQGNVMHLAVTSGGQHHLITQPAQVTVQTTSNTHPVNTPSSASIVNRLPPNASSQVPSSVMSSSGVVKIVVRQSAGKDGGSVPTLAVAPSPRVVPQPAPVQYPSSTPVRSTPVARHTAPIQIAHHTPGPATAHYTIAPPPRIPSVIPSQSHPPRPVLKVVQPPQTTALPTPVQPAPAKATPAPHAPKSPAPQPSDKSSNNNQTANLPKSKPVAVIKAPPQPRKVPHPPPRSPFYLPSLAESLKQQHESKLDLIMQVNDRRCGAKPVYGREVLDILTFLSVPAVSPAPLGSQPYWGRSGHSSCLYAQSKDNFWFQSQAVRQGIHSIENWLQQLKDIIDRFTFVIPSVECPPISMHCCHPPPSQTHKQTVFASMLSAEVAPRIRSLHRIQANMRTQFPDLRLIQYDCGKLQILHKLLRELKTGSHRVLIFTQMTRMLDVLEQFLNYHGHIYLRLDGSTRVEQRQALMERFNADRRIFCFILSTRSGGVGVNLTGADTVIFYDSDWNPTMDAQAQDRCHRIGQTRDVHIYRLISERTVEENILKKANQKRMLGDMAIEGGNFTTAFFKEQTIRELFDVNDCEKREAAVELTLPPAEEEETGNKQSTNILEQALCRAEDEEDIVAASQAKAEQVAELAEFNENIPLDDGGENEEVEEMSKAEQEIAALVEQLTPIERYAMNFLEASLEDVCKEELKQAEEQVEATRKGLDQAKEGGLKLHPSSDDDEDDFQATSTSADLAPTPARRGRKPKDKEKVVASTRTSGRLRGASPEMESELTTPREVPRSVRGRPPKDTGTATPSPIRADHHKTRSQESKTPKATSPAREQLTVKTRSQPNRAQPNQVPSPPTAFPSKRQQQQSVAQAEGSVSKSIKGENESSHEKERHVSECSPVDSSAVNDNPTKEDDNKDQNAMSPPSSCSRSPRKRLTADDEILKGLNEDCPSAKVLRKLPGRLVTVVEEKEPRKRKRRTSGTGGSSEETNTEEQIDNPPNNDKDKPTSSSECKTKEAAEKPKEPESPILPPIRSYPPYSPPHLSPDMPVLRNLPVRRRVETENRMAAQMGELYGRGRAKAIKTDTTQGKDSPEANSTPAKRRRGRPPKCSPDNPEPSSPQPTSPIEARNPALSPKRKRGRNSKDSSMDTESTEQSKTNVANPKTDSEKTLSDKSENPVHASVGPGQFKLLKDEKSDSCIETVSSNASPAVPSKTSEEDKASDKTSTDQEIPPPTAAATVVMPPPTVVRPQTSAPTVVTPPPTTSVPTVFTPPLPTTSEPTVVTPPTSAPTVVTPPPTTSVPTVFTPPLPTTSEPTVVTPPPTIAVPTVVTPPTTIAVPTVVTPPPTTVAPIVVTPPPTTAAPTVVTPPTTAAPTVVTPPTTAAPTVVTPPPPTTAAPTVVTPPPPPTTAVPSVVTPPTPTTAAFTVVRPPPTTSAPTVVTAPPTTSASIVVTAPPTTTPSIVVTAPPTTSAPIVVTPLTAVTTVVLPSSPRIDVVPTTVTPAAPVSATVTPAAPVSATVTPAAPVSATVTPAPAVPATVTPAAAVPATVTPAAAVPATVTLAAAVPTAVMSTTEFTAPTSTPVANPDTTATNLFHTLVTTESNLNLPKVEILMPVLTQNVKMVSTTVELDKTPERDLPQSTDSQSTSIITTTMSEMTHNKPRSFSETQSVEISSISSIKTDKLTTVSSFTASTLQSDEAPDKLVPNTTHSVSVVSTPKEKDSIAKKTEPVSILTEQPIKKNITSPAPITTLPPITSAQLSTILSTAAATSTTTLPVNAISSNLSVSPSLIIDAPMKEIQDPLIISSAEMKEKDIIPNEQVAIVSSVERDPGKLPEEPSAKMVSTLKVLNLEIEEKNENCAPEEKRKKADMSSKAEEMDKGDVKISNRKDDKQGVMDELVAIPKRVLSRQSSQDSTRSSSPSSGCSTHTLTRHAHHKKTYENRNPAKRRRVDLLASEPKTEMKKMETEDETQQDGKQPEDSKMEDKASVQLHHSRSSSSSSDSDTDSKKEHRLTRSAKRRLQDHDGESNTQTKRPAHDRNSMNASTGGESGSDASSARSSRKSTDTKTPAVPPAPPPEPEVLGKRCSALNAAAKLQAMKGNVDTPGHTPRRDSSARTNAAKDKIEKTKSKAATSLSTTNSVAKNAVSKNSEKETASKLSTPNQSIRTPTRSTRQCPGSLVPPLEMEYKKPKAEEKERKKSSGNKEGEREARRSSRGNSACSSISSDEGEGSRSSSNSSQRTHSISSQNADRCGSCSRATSSGSERDRSSERSRNNPDKKDKRDRSRRESHRSNKGQNEVTSSSGAEGTPDRVLRSVAALAAVQARTPAASTRSSASQSRNKT